MPVARTVTDGYIGGSAEVQKVLMELSTELRTKMLIPAVKEVGEVLADAMRFNIPIDTSSLHQSIKVKTLGNKSRGSAVAIIGPQRKLQFETAKGTRQPSRYAHLVEFGHVGKNGEFISPRKPFMRPAVDAVKPIAGEMMANNLYRQFVRTVKKVRRTS